MKKLNIAVLTILLVFQTVLNPLGMFGVTFAGAEGSSDSLVKDVVIKQCSDESCLKQVDITKEGNRVSKSESVYIEYTLDVESINANDTFELTLPDAFKFTENPYLEENGDINAEIERNGSTTLEKVGTFEIVENGKAKFTLTNGDVKELVFVAWAEFIETEKNFETSVKETITILTNSQPKVIEYWTKASAGDIFKTAKANKLMNADEVTWTIDINKGKQKIINAILSDTMTSTPTTTLNLKPGTFITAKEISWDTNGNEVVGKSINLSNATSFPLDLGNNLEDGKVIRVEYTNTFTTNVDLKIENKAVLSGKVNGENVSYEDDFSIELPKGKHLAKSPLNMTDSKISWQVLYNFDAKNLIINNTCSATHSDSFACGVIEDEINVSYVDPKTTKSSHTYDESSIKLYLNDSNTPLTEGTDYKKSVTTGTKLKIELAEKYNNTTSSFRLTYDTVTTGPIYGAFNVNNTVNADGYSETKGKTVLQQFFTKTHVINYETQEIAWKISATGFDMKGAVLTDTSELDIKNDSVQVKVGGQVVNIADKAASTKSLELDFSTINKEWSASDKLEVTYVTPLPEGIGDGKYNNTAGLKWKISENEFITVESISKTAELKQDAISNGYKNSQYNYLGDAQNYRTIDWEVGYNFNRDNTVDGQIKDIWDYDQVLVGNSIKVYPVKITSNGSWEKDENGVQYLSVTLDGKRGFNANLSAMSGWNAGKPYIITYKTKFENDVIPKHKITNTFTYGSNTNASKYSLTDDLTVKSGGEFVSKSGTPSPKYIDWSVYINKSQSKIPSGAILTDTPINQQFVEKTADKFITITKLQTNDGVTFTKTNETFTDFIESYDATTNKLTITFNKDLDAAYVMEYKTYIAKQSGEFVNNVTFSSANGSITIPSESVTNGKTVVNASGSGAWATAKLKSDINPFNGLTLNVTKKASGNNSYFNDQYQSQYKQGTVLKGVVYELFIKNADNTYLLKDTATTDNNGVATFTGLAFEDYYYVKEKTGLPGYKTDATYYPVDLEKDSNGDVIGFKKELTNNRIIYDASFKTCKQNNNPAPGKYEVSLGSNTIVVEVDSTGTPKIINTDDQHKVSIKDGIPTFNTSGTPIEVDVFDGNIRLKNLPEGEYTIKQIETLPGYQLSSNRVVNSGKNTTINNVNLDCLPLKVTITNQEPPKDMNNPDDPHEGSIITGSTFKLYKLPDNSCPQPGVVTDVSGYTPVTKYNDQTPINLTTNTNGKIEIDFSKLGQGMYIVVQDKANSYYVNKFNELVLFGGLPCIEVDETPPTNTSTTFKNIRDGQNLPPLSLVKIDKNEPSKYLEGAVITLTGDTKGKTYVGKTGTDGKITEWYAGTIYPTAGATPITKIVADKYTLKETTFPKGYTVFEAAKFDYHNGLSTTQDATIVVTNKKILSTITIENVCGKEGSAYQLYKVENGSETLVTTDLSSKTIGSTMIIGGTSNDNVISIASGNTQTILENLHLEAGTYKLVQISASAGCEIDIDILPFTIVPNNPTQTFKPIIDDTPIKTPIKNQEEGTNNPIPGSTFKVYKSNDNTSCPLNGTPIGTSTYTDVTNLVPGATEKSTGNFVLTTKNDGTFEIDWSKLGSGKFVIVQDEVNTYYINKQNVPVQIDTSTCYTNGSTPSTTSPTFNNERGKTTVTLTKVETGTQNKVAGAQITITGSRIDTTKKYVATTDAAGVATFVDVAFDDYVITETKYPVGYEGLLTSFTANKFVLDSTTATTNNKIEISNKKVVRTVQVTDACTLGERVYGIYEDVTSTTPIDTITIAAGQKVAEKLVHIPLPDGQSSTNYVVKQISTTDSECEHSETPTFPVTRDEEPTPKKIVDFASNLVTLEFISCGDKVVEGTEYTFQNGNESYTVKVGPNGKVTKDLPKGVYTIVELNNKSVDLTSLQTITIQVDDCVKPPIEFKYCDAVDILVEGTHTVYKASDTTKTQYRTITVDSDGKGTLSHELPKGDYYIIIGSKEYKITVADNSLISIQTGDCYKPVIMFEKCDQPITTSVNLVTYVLTDVNEPRISYTFTGSESSVTPTANIGKGTYTVTINGEELPGKAVVDGSSTIKVQTSINCYTAEVSFKNCAQDATTVNYKVTKDGDASFTPVQITTLTNGKAELTDLAPGTYTVTKGGTTSSTSFTITPGQTGSTTLTIINTPCPPPACEKDVTITVTPGKTITVDGKTYTDGDNDGKVIVPIKDLPKISTLTVTEDGKTIGTVTTSGDCEATFTPTTPACEKDVTITVTPGKIITVDGKTYTDGDNDGKVIVPIKDLPKNSILTVTEDGKTIGTVTTSGDCEAAFKPAASCTEAFVTLKDYANQAVSITKDGGTATTAKVDVDGKLVIPHKDGKIVVLDAQGKEIGAVTLVDCKGTFEFKNVCTAATLTVTELANKSVTAEHNGKTVTVTFDKDGTVQLPFTDGKVTLKDGEKVLGSVDLKDCKGTFVLEIEKEACTYPESVTVPTEHAGKTATVTNGYATSTVVVPATGVIQTPFTKGTTTVTIEGAVVATITEKCNVVVETEEIPVDSVKPDLEKPEPVEPVEPETEPGPTPKPNPTPTPTPEPSPNPTPTPTPEPSPNPTPTPTPGPSPNPTPTPTPEPSPNPAPTPTLGGSVIPPTPGANNNGGTNLPTPVVDLANKHDNLVLGYPSQLPTQTELQELKKLYEDYVKMTPKQKREFEKLMDVEKLKQLLLAEGVKLPQTNGDSNGMLMLLGVLLVAFAGTLLVRRRQTN